MRTKETRENPGNASLSQFRDAAEVPLLVKQFNEQLKVPAVNHQWEQNVSAWGHGRAEAALLPGRYHRPLATPRADGPSALSAPDRVSASGSRDQGTCNAKGPGADRPGRGRLIRPAGESPMTIRPDVRGSRAHPAPRLPGRTAPSRRAIDRRELAGRPRQRNRLAGPPPQGCLRRRSPRHDASRLDGPVAAGGADAFRRRR